MVSDKENEDCRGLEQQQAAQPIALVSYLLYISSYTWMEAPMLSYCPCLIHSHALAYISIRHTDVDNHVLHLYSYAHQLVLSLLCSVYTVSISSRDHLCQTGFSSCNTKFLLARSGSIMEVHWKIKGDSLSSGFS